MEFRVALPALAPQHGTVERSMRLESDVMAPACHQKKIPPPGNTSRAGALIIEPVPSSAFAVAELARSPGVRCKSQRKTSLRSMLRNLANTAPEKSSSPHESVAAAVSASVTAARISEG